jgi:hypothetical protein
VKRIASEFKLESSIKVLYCSLVRSIVEYGSVLWDRHTTSSSLQLERVQRRFLSFAAYVLKIDHVPHDYFPVLTELHLSSLVDRRATANLSFLRKLLDGSIDAPTLLSSINFKVPQRSLRSHTTFSIPNCSTNYGRNNPVYRLMRIANEQPSFLY